MKKVTQNGTVTSHERYLYRGYLQIAALDMLNSRNAVSYTHLDVYKRQCFLIVAQRKKLLHRKGSSKPGDRTWKCRTKPKHCLLYTSRCV